MVAQNLPPPSQSSSMTASIPPPTGSATSSFAFIENTSMTSLTTTASPTTSPTQPPTTTPPSTPSGSALPLSTLLVAIIVPIAFIIIIIPIIYLAWVRHRTKGNKRNGMQSPPDSSTPAPETRLLRHSPQSSMLLPSPFNDSDRIKEGSLGVYELRRSLEDKGRSDSIGVFGHFGANGRISPPLQRGPSPTLPSPRVPAFTRPPSEAWPLPSNAKLPSPTTLYDPHLNTNKPLPSPAPVPAPQTPLPPPPSIPNDRAQNPDVRSYASSDVLVAPGSVFRPVSSNYDLTPSTATFPETVRSGTTQATSYEQSQQTRASRRERDSDLVSELSYRETSPEREGERRRDIDAISVVSAMTDKKRRSERDPDAMSVISALSPEEPRIPMEHFPLR